jgi:hypothetical protein
MASTEKVYYDLPLPFQCQRYNRPFAATDFLIDTDGKLVAFIPYGTFSARYVHIDFDTYQIELNVIVDGMAPDIAPREFQGLIGTKGVLWVWYNPSTSQYNIAPFHCLYDRADYTRTIPGVLDNVLTPVQRLYLLEDEITDSISGRLENSDNFEHIVRFSGRNIYNEMVVTQFYSWQNHYNEGQVLFSYLQANDDATPLNIALSDNVEVFRLGWRLGLSNRDFVPLVIDLLLIYEYFPYRHFRIIVENNEIVSIREEHQE